MTTPRVQGRQGVDGRQGGPEGPGNISEEQFRALLEMIPAGAFVWDTGRTLYVNAAAGRLTGYPVEELLEIGPLDLVHPDSAPYLVEQQARARAGQDVPREYEFKIIRKQGDVRWVQMALDRVHGDGENRWIGTSTDITERKLAEEALRRSAERYRILYQDNPSMYFTVGPDGIVIDVNDFGASQLGYTPGDLIGRQVLDVFVDEDRETVAGQIRALLDAPGETRMWELRKVKRDGTVIWVEETARATRDAEGKQVVMIVCEDITDRRRMEEELRESEARLRAFAEAVPDLTMIMDRDGRYIEILGRLETKMTIFADPERLIGKRMHDVLPRAPADTFLAAVRKSIATGAPQYLEYSLDRPSGTEWFEASVAPFTMKGQSLVVWVARNTTERKRLERELVELREELEQKAELVAERGSAYGLSFRELTVLQLVVDGRSDKEVAAILGITRMTASKHVARILRKLRVNSRTAAGVMAVRERLIA